MESVGRLAIPVFEGRVSPRLDCASRFLLLEASNGTWREELHLACRTPFEMAERLQALGVGLVICGGVSSSYEQRLSEAGLRLIAWVTGPVSEVVRAYLQGSLEPGLRCPERRRRQRGGQRSGSRQQKEAKSNAKT